MKRLFWFALGVVAGIVGLRYVKDKAREATSGLSVETVLSDLASWSSNAVKQVEEILRNVVARDGVQRSANEADVFVSGSAANDRPGDL